MQRRSPLIVLIAALVLAASACGSATPTPTATREPTDIPQATDAPVPTDTPIPTHTPTPPDTATPRPTDTPRPTPTPKPTATATPSTTTQQQLQAYADWLRDVYPRFKESSEELIQLWRQGSTQAVTRSADTTIEDMEAVCATLASVAETVEGKDHIPEAFELAHARLTQMVTHFNSAAVLLTEGLAALNRGDEEGFQDTADEATTELQLSQEAEKLMMDALEGED